MTLTFSRIAAALLLLAAMAGLGGITASAGVGHAAGTTVATAKLSTFRPSALPPACTPQSQTLSAVADSWTNEQSPAANNGTVTTLNVTSRSTRDHRTLVKFTLPSAPTGCTLTTATLRLNNVVVAAGRTIDAYRAGAAWTETGVTWTSQPAVAGTAVGVASAAGWMEWTVTTHVQAMYAGTDNGFVLRDSVEDKAGAPFPTQQFSSREGANPPQLVLQWN